VRDPERAAAMGRAGRTRAVERFAWDAVARETVDVYREARAGRLGASTAAG
jgi:starch synthase